MRIMLATALSIVLLLASPAQAQNETDTLIMGVDLICRPDTDGQMTEALPKKFGELQFARGKVKIKSKALNQYVEAEIYMYVNPQNGGFTILSQVHGDPVVCILANGMDFVPWVPNKPTL